MISRQQTQNKTESLGSRLDNFQVYWYSDTYIDIHTQTHKIISCIYKYVYIYIYTFRDRYILYIDIYREIYTRPSLLLPATANLNADRFGRVQVSIVCNFGHIWAFVCKNQKNYQWNWFDLWYKSKFCLSLFVLFNSPAIII